MTKHVLSVAAGTVIIWRNEYVRDSMFQVIFRWPKYDDIAVVVMTNPNSNDNIHRDREKGISIRLVNSTALLSNPKFHHRQHKSNHLIPPQHDLFTLRCSGTHYRQSNHSGSWRGWTAVVVVVVLIIRYQCVESTATWPITETTQTCNKQKTYETNAETKNTKITH